jgi:hypothetical protein
VLSTPAIYDADGVTPFGDANGEYTATGVVCTRAGYLIVSSVNALYTVELATGIATRLSGDDKADGFADGDVQTARYSKPAGLTLIESDQSLLVAELSNHCIRSVPLPARLFDVRSSVTGDHTGSASSVVAAGFADVASEAES